METTLLVPLLWIVFLVALCGSLLFGLLFAYHWTRYGASPTLSIFTVSVYGIGCLVLLGIMLGAIVTI